MNKHCTCPLAGFCARHQIEKTERQFALCKGEAVERPDCGFKFWHAWETGKFGAVAQDPPMLDWECESQAVRPPVLVSSSPSQRYLGDHVEQALSLVGITKERVAKALGGCGGCSGRQAKLNAIDQAAREIVGGAVEAGREKLAKLLGGEQ